MSGASREGAPIGWPEGALVLIAGLTPLLGADDAVVAAVRYAVILGVAAGWVWWLSRGGGASLFRDRRLSSALLACTVAVLVAAAASPIAPDALAWSFGEGTAATYWIACLVIFAGASSAPLDRGVRGALGAIAVAVLALGIIGVLQRYSGVPVSDTIAGGSNRLGPLCAMTAAVALGLAETARTNAETTGWRVGALALAMCAVLSGATSATLALLAGLGVVLLWRPSLVALPARTHRTVRWTTAVVLATMVLIVVVAATTEVLPRPIDDAVDSQIQGESGVARFRLWDVAGQMATARPLTGWGPDGFEYGGQSFVTEELMAMVYDEAGVSHDPRTVLPQDPHSFVMTVAAELGLLGVIAFAVLAGAWTRRVWRARGAAPESGLHDSLVIATVSMAFASFFIPADPVGGVTGVLVAGLAVSHVDGGAPKWGVRVPTVIAASATVAAVVLGSLTLAAAVTVESAFNQATDARILSGELQDAVRLQPGSSMRTYQRMWADAYRVGVDLTPEGFVSLYDSAPASVRGFAPYATRLISILISRDSSASTLTWASKEVDRVVALAPAYPESRILSACITARQGRVDDARDILDDVSWASASGPYQTCVAEIDALAEGQD